MQEFSLSQSTLNQIISLNLLLMGATVHSILLVVHPLSLLLPHQFGPVRYTILRASPKDESKMLFSANEHDPKLTGLGPADLDGLYYEGNWTTVSTWKFEMRF